MLADVFGESVTAVMGVDMGVLAWVAWIDVLAVLTAMALHQCGSTVHHTVLRDIVYGNHLGVV